MSRAPSLATQKVLRALLDGGDHYGWNLMKTTGLASGSLYPILMRLEEAGWIEGRWIESPHEGRPRRKVYRLTGSGATNAQAVLRETVSALDTARLSHLLPGVG